MFFTFLPFCLFFRLKKLFRLRFSSFGDESEDEKIMTPKEEKTLGVIRGRPVGNVCEYGERLKVD